MNFVMVFRPVKTLSRGNDRRRVVAKNFTVGKLIFVAGLSEDQRESQQHDRAGGAGSPVEAEPGIFPQPFRTDSDQQPGHGKYKQHPAFTDEGQQQEARD